MLSIALYLLSHAMLLSLHLLYGDNVFEKCGINRDRARRGGKRRYFQGKTGLFTRDRTGRGPGFLGYFETGASTRSALFFYALLSHRRG